MDEAGAFAIAVGLGLLIGLQRQHSESTFAGLRTFPIVSILGFLCGISGNPLLIAAGLAGLAGFLAVDHWVHERRTLTTGFALLSMYGIGAMTASGHTTIAIVSATTIAILLEFKVELHGLADKLSEADIKAFLQFAVISLVILPVLPDQTYGPYQVLNPRQIWWMVVLIVGMNLAGYLAYRFVSPEKGVWISGILGGIISSTATTAAYSRKGGPVALVVILVAGATVYIRLATEVATTAPQLIGLVLPRLALPFLALAGWAGWYWWQIRGDKSSVVQEGPKKENPTEIRIALLFAAGYALILVLNAAAKEILGDRGVLGLSIAGGLTDVDAITLSTTRLVNTGRVSGETAWQAILIASLSNLAFKMAVGFVLGGPKFGAKLGLATMTAFAAAALAWRIF
jgi:uncharacterized membrane protein (DUF4010 family)